MNGEALINRLFLQVDDSSQLSTEEALEQINEVYGDVQDDRDWEWLKSIFTGIGYGNESSIELPTDFKKICTNYAEQSYRVFGNAGVPVGYIDNSYQPTNVGNVSVVFVNSQPYQVIPFSSRMNYDNIDGYCYIWDTLLWFTKPLSEDKTITFDYIRVAPDITLTTEPQFRSGLHNILTFGAAARFPILEQADKSMSYARDNQALFEKQLQSLQMEDSLIKLSL